MTLPQIVRLSGRIGYVKAWFSDKRNTDAEATEMDKQCRKQEALRKRNGD